MVALTTNHQLPYPTGPDRPCDGWATWEALARRLDGKLTDLGEVLDRTARTRPMAKVSTRTPQQMVPGTGLSDYVVFDTVEVDTDGWVGRPPVDAREPARALHRHLRAPRGGDRRGADVDPRVAARERAPHPRPLDPRRCLALAGRRHAVSSSAPNDTTMLLMLVVFLIAILSTSLTTVDRASDNAVTISAIGAVLILLVYGAWLASYLRAGADQEPAIGEDHAPPLAFGVGLAVLALPGVAAAFTSEWFVSVIDPAVEELGISKAFTGLVIVAIAGVNAIEEKEEKSLVVSGKDLSYLLYNWLEEIIILTITDGFAAKRVTLNIEKNSEYRILARFWGEKIDIKKHHFKVEIKAPTFHEMEIRQNGTIYMKYLLDL